MKPYLFLKIPEARLGVDILLYPLFRPIASSSQSIIWSCH